MREDTKRAIAEFEVNTFGTKKRIEKSESVLTSDEQVLYAAAVTVQVSSINTRTYESLPGVVFLTNKRFIFSCIILSSFSTEIVQLDEIRNINSYGDGFNRGHVEVHTLTKTYNILVTYKKEIVQKIHTTFENAVNNFVNASQNVMQFDPVEQIEKLASLRERGIITEEEFQSKKTELLDNVGSQSVQQTPVNLYAQPVVSSPVLENAEPKHKKKLKRYFIILSIFAIFLWWFVCIFPNLESNGKTQNNDEVPLILDAEIYADMSTNELINLLGEPKLITDWDNQTSKGTFKMTNYAYKLEGMYVEFVTHENNVVQVQCWADEAWKAEKEFDDIFEMFNVTPDDSLKKIVDNGITYKFSPVSDTVEKFEVHSYDKETHTFTIVFIAYDLQYLE